MAENKTKPTKESVPQFLKGLENRKRAEDARVVLKMMKAITGLRPTMWGPSIIGFGTYNYTYESGRSGSVPLVGFSPRKANLTFYIKLDKSLLKKLGKYKTSKACLYITKLEDIEIDILHKLIEKAYAEGKMKQGSTVN